jgi:transcriptional regulator with XRE-family HTH domain
VGECSGAHGTSNPFSRRRANHSLSCVAVSAADPFVVGFPPLDHEAAGSGERLTSAVSRSNGRPCQVHALYKLTSALNFEKTTANTVSRWETATYKPSIAYLEVLARFFGVPMAVFFPGAQPASRTNALISATADLDDRDFEEVTLHWSEPIEREISKLNGRYRCARRQSHTTLVRLVIEENGDLEHEAK